MIDLLAKHLRKWLLGVAVAAQKRVRSIVTRLESSKEDKTTETEREIAPGVAKKARPGGPPDHWVQLVKRHAPELLQMNPPYVVTRAPSLLFETGAEMDESAPEDIQELKSDRGAIDDGDVPAQGDLSDSSSPPRAPKENDDPGSKRQTPTQDNKRQTGDGYRIAGVTATSPKHTRDRVAIHTPVAARPGSVKAGRLSVSPTAVDNTMHRRTSGQERDERSVPTEGPRTGFREVDIPDTRKVAVQHFQLTARKIEKIRPGAKEKENILTPEQSGRRGEQGYRKEPEHEAGSQVNARIKAPKEIKQESGYDTSLAPGGSYKMAGSSLGTGVKTPALQIKRSGDDRRHVNEVRIIKGQRTAYPPEDREKVAEKISPPAELSWPSLPGEKDSEDVRASHLSATWPSLPAERSAEVKLPSNQMEPHPSEAESRNIERLRRLDEEQKGAQWSESHL